MPRKTRALVVGMVFAATPVLGSAQATSPTATVAGAVEAEVSLAFRGGHLVVPVTASDGTQLHFGISTGSDRTVLSESGRRRVGSASLALGGLPVPTEPIGIVPDAGLMADGQVLDGRISSNMLAEYDVLFDVPGGRLLLRTPGREVAWDGVALSEPVRLRILHGIVISLDATLDGREYPASLDVGSPTVVANRGVQSDLELPDDGQVSLELGSASFPGTPIQVRDLEIFERWSPTGAGFVIVGASFLADCPVALSWIHRELRTCVR